MLTHLNSQRDIPLTLALVWALVVGGALVFLLPLKGMIDFKGLQGIVLRNQTLILISSVCLLINSFCLSLLIRRYIGNQKQGIKLAKIRGERVYKEFFKKGVFLIILIGIIEDIVQKLLNFYFPLASSELTLLSSFPNLLMGLIGMNISGTCSLFLLKLSKLMRPFPKRVKKANKLSKRPRKRRTVYLGTEAGLVKNGEFVEKNHWVSMPEKALNGSMLITGSVGSGKTASLVLPLVEQIINNFRPFPSILAIDPKNSFNRDLLNLLKKKKEFSRVLHLKLDGNVTLNPFYRENPLKDAAFMEVAKMFRMAADNFTGDKGSSSVFWDESAFILLKNAVIYCGAIYGYTTMSEIYKTLIGAIDNEETENMVSDLRDALDEGDFDKEEKFNINCAITFFLKEFDKLDNKMKTGVLATATVFLNMFQEFHAHRIFCPSKEDLTISSMDDVVNGGKILIFDIQNEGLSAPMGTFVKLLYSQSVLNRTKGSFKSPKGKMPSAVVVIDEYPDVVSVTGRGLNDATLLAKGRSSKLIFIAASQSFSSLKAVIKDEKSSNTLFQNFRTKIACHSSDEDTINHFKFLAGQREVEKKTHSISELSQRAEQNLLMGGFDSDAGNISESVSTSTQKEFLIDAKEFSSLNTFEAIGIIYDGVQSKIKRLCLKPYFLAPHTSHRKILRKLKREVASLAFIPFVFLSLNPINVQAGLPTICKIIKSARFSSCMDMKTRSCVCKGFPPRPCRRMSYYIPQTFIEVHKEAKESYFKALPGVISQLTTVKSSAPQAAVDDNGAFTFGGIHSLSVPFQYLMWFLPCGGMRPEKTCFDGMSEHLGDNWKTGKADLYQPRFLAWSATPNACLIKGVVTSYSGGGEAIHGNEGGCSYPLSWLIKYPPSTHSQCSGWGTHFPRTGTHHGNSKQEASLNIASRMKSLSSEVFRSTPSSTDEKWQMLIPSSSGECFREGENMGILEVAKRINEVSRPINWEKEGYLYGVWKKVSCCVDIPVAIAAKVALKALRATCEAL